MLYVVKFQQRDIWKESQLFIEYFTFFYHNHYLFHKWKIKLHTSTIVIDDMLNICTKHMSYW